jgi:hypothetical protein
MDKIEFMYLIKRLNLENTKLIEATSVIHWDNDNEMPCSISDDIRRFFDAIVNFFNCLPYMIEKLKNHDVTTNG